MVIAFVIAVSPLGVFALEYPTASVVVDGVELVFDQPAIIVNSRTMVPLRKIFEALGAHVTWDGDSQTVVAKKGATTISLQIGSNRVYKVTPDGADYFDVDVSAMLLNSRTLVPVRAISEALDAVVGWNGETSTVTVESARKDIHDMYLPDESNTAQYSVLVGYPQIDGYDAANAKIKAAFESLYETERSKKETESKTDLDGSLLYGWMFMPHNYEALTEVTYVGDGKICLLTHISDFSGGVRTNTSRKAFLFDATTGDSIEIDSALKAQALALFEKMINANPENFNADALKTLNEDVINGYIAEGGYVFFINPDVIAPYAAGSFEVTVE